MKNIALNLSTILLSVFLGSFAYAASDTVADTDPPADCCLPVLEKEVPQLEAKVYLEPGGNSAPFYFPTEPRPSKKGEKSKERTLDINDPIWDEEKYDARDRWTIEDTLYQTQYAVLHIIDWGQTRYIADSPEFYEMNPILGANPNRGEVDLYFAATLVGHTAVAFILPEKWRRKWQFFWIGLESFITASNSAAGVSIAF